MRFMLAVGAASAPYHSILSGVDGAALAVGATFASAVYGCSFSADGQYLALAGTGAPRLQVLRTSDWSIVEGATSANGNYECAFSPDGQYLASMGASSPFLRIYNTSNWTLVSGVSIPQASTHRVAWSPDGQYLAVGLGGAPWFRVFRVADWTVISGTPTLPGAARGISWSPDGSLCAVSHVNGARLSVYNPADWSLVSGAPSGAGGQDTAFSPDGQFLAVAASFTLRIYHVSTWGLLYTSPNLTDIDRLRWSPDGAYLAMTRGSPGLVIFDTSNWSYVNGNVSFTNGGSGLAFGPPLPDGPLPVQVVPEAERHFSLDWSGLHDLDGVVKQRVGDVDVATRARVNLLEAGPGKRLIDRTWSDPDTGAFRFKGLDTARRRFVTLAEYPANPDNPAAENYLRPVAGVSKKAGEGEV